MRQAKVAKLEMMTVSFPVCSHIHEGPELSGLLEHADQQLAGRQRLLKSDRASQWAIVKEDCDRPASFINVTIGPGRVNPSISNLPPFNPSLSAKTCCLLRRENDKAQTLVDKQAKNGVITSRFWQPERLWFPSKPMAKVGEAPHNLSQAIAPVA